MERRDGRKLWVCRTSIAVAVLASGPAMAAAASIAPNVRLVHNSERFAVAQALASAARMLSQPSCEALLDEFKDASGRPLRAALEPFGVSAPEYLEKVFFYDAPEKSCRASALAMTNPGSRAIVVCGSRFVRAMSLSPRHAETTLVHETLHSLGLGENPPSSDYITERVMASCTQR
jgi:hypothetical protein